MKKVLRPAIICILALTLICGVAYPLIVTGVSQIAFKDKANGSIITVTLKDGKEVSYGSELIAQTFTKPKYLIGRPDSGSPTNLSPVSKEQEELVQERINFFKEIDPENTAEIPMDLVTASGSGVDPHISPEAAEYQVNRIAIARGISEEEVRKIIENHTEGRLLGVLGEPTVNVLMVNLELDGLI
ncbi:potassium-transporting ATPase subunit KdpC [Clostridium sp. UBA1056]|uniref:potassium-transporting ATPase subunit KdpC n=1 Tax=unclassified Clostridium TaxID=2614128 RepID=UPI003217F976